MFAGKIIIAMGGYERILLQELKNPYMVPTL
jgi:hypothetical protein